MLLACRPLEIGLRIPPYRRQTAPWLPRLLFLPFLANHQGEGSILRQDVDFTKLFLKLLDTLDAIRVSFSVTLSRDDRPALIAWYDRNRD